MIKKLALLASAGVAGLLAIAATRPADFRVERSVSIQASADRIYPLINDLREFNRWNPYARKDPAMKSVFRGPTSGAGAAYDFHGNKDVGKGSIEIVNSSAPDHVTMKLDMIEPFEGHNIVEFSLIPRDGATDVTWAMHGPSPFISRLIGLFFNMDRMIGSDFETGLATLKAMAEQQ